MLRRLNGDLTMIRHALGRTRGSANRANITPSFISPIHLPSCSKAVTTGIFTTLLIDSSRSSLIGSRLGAASNCRSFHSSTLFKSQEKPHLDEINDAHRRKEEWDRFLGRRKLQSRKRRALTAMHSKTRQEPTVTALAIAEDFDLQAVANDLAINNLYQVTYIDEEFDDTLHLTKRKEYVINADELCEMFIFRDGVVVFWNVHTIDRAALLRDVERFARNPYESSIALEELDRMPFKIVESSETEIKHDRFCLANLRHSPSAHRSTESILERFALSQAFAASVKIGVWEASLTSLAEPLSKTTRALQKGYIPWNRKETLKHSGEFAALRHLMNLNSNLLNQDFYWDRGNLESYYKIAARHFMLQRRLNTLNSRIDYCEELVKMVDNMLALRHASTLEWMIIVLIVIEVIFDLLHYFDNTPHKVIVVQQTAANPDSVPSSTTNS